MYNSRVKQCAYDLKKRGLSLEGALANLYVGRLALMHGRKEKYVRRDLRLQLSSIGGKYE